MTQTDFSGAGEFTTADQCRIGNRVVGRPERPSGYDALAGGNQTGYRVYFGGFERFLKS